MTQDFGPRPVSRRLPAAPDDRSSAPRAPGRRHFLGTAAAGAGALLAGPASTLAPARAQGRTKVTFAWPFATTSQAFQEELARRFMDGHRSIEIEVQVIPQTQAVPKLTAAFTGGAAPDCLALSHQWLTQFAGGEYLESLEPHLKASGLDRDLAPPLMAEARVVGNTAHSAGFLADAYVLYCSRAFLREAGVAEPPRTFDEFAQVARRMTDAGRNRFGYYALGATGWSYNQWTSWMLGHGGLGARNGYFDAGGKCVLRGDPHVAGLQRWLDLYQKDKVSPTASATGGWQDSANAFNAGQLGMVFGWMGLIGNFTKSLGADAFTVVPPPSGPAGQFFYVGGNGYAINRQSKVKEAAWEYVRYLLTPEVNGLLNKEWGAIPGNMRAWTQPWLDTPHFRAPRRMVESSAALIRYPSHLPEWPQWFLNVCPPNIQKAMLGQQSARQHADTVATALEAMVAKSGKTG
jgi:multiple sugar transport system substrate-binding protein